MEVRIGEIYGKRKGPDGYVMYAVLQVRGDRVTLQNLDGMAGPFDSDSRKLAQGGYELVSQTPYVPHKSPAVCGRSRKPRRCPDTFDFLEGRADKERPAPIFSSSQAA